MRECWDKVEAGGLFWGQLVSTLNTLNDKYTQLDPSSARIEVRKKKCINDVMALFPLKSKIIFLDWR